MSNPWLDIPLADYEAHMALPAVGQSRLIADELAALVRTHSPGSVAVILRRHCKPNGVLAVLAQLPHETTPHVSPSPFTSLQRLAPGMRLISQEELHRQARHAGFAPERSRVRASPGGKRFSIDEFRASSWAGAGAS